jgi:hypothetical protein
MSIATETAAEYFRLASLASERRNVGEALRYSERATDTLLRGELSETERPATLRGEHMNYELLGKVLAAKAERAARG